MPNSGNTQNPFLEELERLANSQDPADEPQLQRMIFRTLVYLVERMDAVATSIDSIDRQRQEQEQRIEGVENIQQQVNSNAQRIKGNHERLKSLENTVRHNPSLILLAKQHPIMIGATLFTALALLIWFLGLPPEAQQAFLGIFR